MRTKSFMALVAALVVLCLAASESKAGVNWSVSIFNGPLGSCGYWINHPDYGRCWQPAYVASNWYPYCEGYWMWTSCGWYWVSSEPWAWATYRYGRWAYDPYYRWVWVPDTEWGPSWVCWREGGGYCGWAALPPGAALGPGGDVIYRNGPVPDRFFVFVELGHFSEPIHRRDVIVNNTMILNKTVNITKITRVNNVVVNHGPGVDEIQKYSARKLTEAPSRATYGSSVTTRSPGTLPEVVKPNGGESEREPVRVGQAGKGEPQVIRGGSGQGVYDYKQPGNQRVAPTPTEYKPTTEKPERPPPETSQNFGTRGSSPYSPAAPDSVQPRQRASTGQAPQNQPSRDERASEKQGQPAPEQGREEDPKRGQQSGN